jgi:hypothetical protein
VPDLADGTRGAYNGFLDRWSDALGDKKVSDIQAADIAAETDEIFADPSLAAADRSGSVS